MSRVDELLDHAKARVATVEVPYSLSIAREQRRLKTQLVLVVAVCSALLVALGSPSGTDRSLSISPQLGQEHLFAILDEEGAK
ncbi:MAG TPA: hypothetical protein VK171_01340 [Fimbriimonas sp.]|nr:hypothetical protein [Fimbriimonas sp.]